MTCDFAVLGDGIIGRSIAYALVRDGHRVALLSQHRERAATPASGGMLSQVSEADDCPPALQRLLRESAQTYPRFVAEVEEVGGKKTDYVEGGTMLVAVQRDHLAQLQRVREANEAAGIACEALTAAQIQKREPYVNPRVVGGLLAERDGYVDPMILGEVLKVAFSHLGGESVVLAPSEAFSFERTEGAFTLCAGGEVQCVARQVVLAHGAWTDHFLPVRLGLRPVTGQVAVLRGERLLNHVLRTPDVYLIPRADGRLWVGATLEEVGFEPEPKAGAVMRLLRDAWCALPGIDEMTFVGTMVGLRPALRDGLPAVGKVGEGIWAAVGHYRYGVTLAPWTAEYLAGLVRGAGTVAESVDPLRFAERPD